jgi:hypothetical protein
MLYSMKPTDPRNFINPRHSALVAKELLKLLEIETFSFCKGVKEGGYENVIWLQRSMSDTLPHHTIDSDLIDSDASPRKLFEAQKIAIDHKPQIVHLTRAIKKLANVEIITPEEQDAIDNGNKYIEILRNFASALIANNNNLFQKRHNRNLPQPGDSEHSRYISFANKIGTAVDSDNPKISASSPATALAQENIHFEAMEEIVWNETQLRIASALEKMLPLITELQQALNKEKNKRQPPTV